MSNMSAPSRRRCRPASGAASARTTTSSRSNASMDELARKAGKDPVDFRRRCSASKPRAGGAQSRGGKSRLGRSRCRRASAAASRVQPSFDTFIATVVEAEVDDEGEVKLRRVTSVVDTGIAVNPDTVMAQLEGGLIFGLTAALYGEITIDKGRVQQSQLPRLPDAAHQRDAEDRGACRQERRGAGRHRRDRRQWRPAGAAQRDLCRNRRARCGALPIDRSLIAGGEEGMRWAVRILVRPRRRRHCRRSRSAPGSSAGPARSTLPAAPRSRWRIIAAPNLPASRRRLETAEPDRARRISGQRGGLHGLPHQAGRHGICRRSGFKLPFGTLYSTNITPDKETGIGNYSDQDFLNAVQRGKRRDGAMLYPAMPYTSYTYMTDADAAGDQGLSVQPAAGARGCGRRNTLSFPFNQRWAMAVLVRGVQSGHALRRRTPRRSPEWNRGAYLAEALAHCGECHTPRNLAFALDNRKKFAGAVTAGWRAFNISSRQEHRRRRLER